MKALLVLTAAATSAWSAAIGIAWSNSVESSLARAKALSKPVLLFMKVEWSAYCAKMRREVFTDAGVAEQSKAFVPVMLDGDHEGRSVARKYNVTGYPEVLFLDANGTVAWRASGVLDAAQMRRAMASALAAVKTFPKLLAALQKNPNDTAAMAQLVLLYAARKDFNAARAMLKRAESADPTNQTGLLGAAWNGLGDALQNAMAFNEAKELFEKCAKQTKRPDEVAYARASIAACWAALGRSEEAMKVLEDLIASPDTPAKHKEQARAALERLKKTRESTGLGAAGKAVG